MILHICTDDKFTDYVMNIFESVNPGGNVYFILNTNQNDPLKYVREIKGNAVISDGSCKSLVDLISTLNQFKAVILHNFVDKFKVELVLEAPASTHFHWMSWGADLYCHPQLSRNTYDVKTKEYLAHQRNRNWYIDKFFEIHLSFIHRIFHRSDTVPLYVYKTAISKIKSCSTVIPEEACFIQYYTRKKIDFLPFKYCTIEGLLAGCYDSVCLENNILLGNSATPTNNHFEAIDAIAKSYVLSSKVFIPLSYGDSHYANEVIKYSKEALDGLEVVPLIDFLPLYEYVGVLKSCGVVIMNHIRQQAVGNIVAALWMGAKVFFNPQSLVYIYFKELNLLVYSLDDLVDCEALPSYSHHANHNRIILNKIYSLENVCREAKSLIDYLNRVLI